MLAATLLALAAAVLHAAWNLAVKQAPGDRFLALWGQFAVAGLVGGVALVAVGGIPAAALPWAALSGAVHVPYVVFLARAYDRRDFSLVYPVARGTGAVLAALGGMALLGDRLPPLALVAVGVVGAGLVALAGRGSPAHLADALAVAAAIGVYSVADARGVRAAHTAWYALAAFVAIAVAVSAAGLATGRGRGFAASWSWSWRRYVLTGLCSQLTYSLVIVAFRTAPVGYVTALRESSVVLAALVGWRVLGERAGRRRVAASTTVFAGLVLLVAAR